MKIEDGWVVHQNGELPYFVRERAGDMEIFLRVGAATVRRDSDVTIDLAIPDDGSLQTYVRVNTFPVDWVHPSTNKPQANPEEIAGMQPSEYEGYAVLGKLKDTNSFICVTDAVLRLDLEDGEELDPDTIVSTSCSNDAWYTMLVTNKAFYTTDHCTGKGAASMRITREKAATLPPDSADPPDKPFDPYWPHLLSERYEGFEETGTTIHPGFFGSFDSF